MANWWNNLDLGGTLEPNPELVALANQADQGQNVSGILDTAISAAGNLVPGHPNFLNFLETPEVPAGTQMGMALPLNPAMAMRGMLGRTALQAGARTLPQAGGAGGRIPPQPPAGITSPAASGSNLPVPRGSNLPGPTRPQAQGQPSPGERFMGTIDGSAARAPNGQGLPSPQSPVGAAGSASGSGGWWKGPAAVLGLGTLVGVSELMQEAPDVVGAETEAVLPMITSDTPEGISSRELIVNAARDIVFNPEKYRTLTSIDYGEYGRRMEEINSVFLEQMDNQASPEERDDPSWWQKMLRVIPGVLAGFAVAGPMGALAGGVHWGLGGEIADNVASRANRAEWRDHAERRLAGASQGIGFEQSLGEANRAQELQDIQLNRWHQAAEKEDDAYLRGARSEELGLLAALTNIESGAMRNEFMSNLFQGQGQGRPGGTSHADIQAVIQQMIMQNPEGLGDLLQNSSLGNMQSLSLPSSMTDPMFYNNFLQETQRIAANGDPRNPQAQAQAQAILAQLQQGLAARQQEQAMNQIRSLGGL